MEDKRVLLRMLYKASPKRIHLRRITGAVEQYQKLAIQTYGTHRLGFVEKVVCYKDDTDVIVPSPYKQIFDTLVHVTHQVIQNH